MKAKKHVKGGIETSRTKIKKKSWNSERTVVQGRGESTKKVNVIYPLKWVVPGKSASNRKEN